MKSTINLLPSELNIRSGSGKVHHILRNLTFVFGIIFFVAVLAAFGYIYYLNNEIQTAQQEQASLHTKIESLSGTEQKLFIIKDRLAKIQTILSNKQSEETLDKVQDTISSMSGTLAFNAIKVEGGNTSLTLVSSDSLSAKSFIEQLIANSNYLHIILKSLGFNSTVGYTLSLQLF